MRSVFFGTPPIAVPALEALHDISDVVGVVCQPDRPAGRGLKVHVPAVKARALELGLPVHQPVKVKTGNLDAWLRERDVDVAVVLAYGRILPPQVLKVPRRGCMNLHASLLPAYRGAAPINWAIIHGETRTGMALMQMDAGMDTGAVYVARELDIGAEETAGELAVRLGKLAATVVREDLTRAVDGELAARPQDEETASYAPLLTKEHAQVDWSATSRDIANLVRGLAPKPGAHTTLRGKTLKLHAARALSSEASLPTGVCGEVLVADKSGLVVAAGSGAVELLRAQLQGKKALASRDLVNGRTLEVGDVLGRDS